MTGNRKLLRLFFKGKKLQKIFKNIEVKMVKTSKGGLNAEHCRGEGNHIIYM